MKNDKYLMDGNKLNWHLDRVVDWKNSKRIAPIHIDVGISKGCNIKCHYCFGALQGNKYLNGRNDYLQRDILLNYFKDAGEVGVKSIAIIGEAEPLINPHVYEAIEVGTKSGIDLALGTNGVEFSTSRDGESALENLTWIRFNISAATKEAYIKCHGMDYFDTVIEKIKFCVKYKKQRNLDVTIGLQMVLTPDDLDQAPLLAKIGQELGVDYLVIKQCCDDRSNSLGIYDRLGEYASQKFTDLLSEAESYSTDEYNVIVKWGAIQNEGKRSYTQCLGAPFLLYSSGEGKVFSCGMFFENKGDDLLLGDLSKNSFKEILNSDQYWKVMEEVKNLPNCQNRCYSNCRTNSINEYLNQLANPPKHINFI